MRDCFLDTGYCTFKVSVKTCSKGPDLPVRRRLYDPAGVVRAPKTAGRVPLRRSH